MPGWGLHSIFDFLFPRYCFSCQQLLRNQEILFCQECQEKLPWLDKGCPVCAGPGDPNYPCERCQKERFFTRVLAPFRYEGPVAEAIKALKYGRFLWLAKDLSRFWQRRLRPPDCDLVLPVPLHPERLRKRGFNQSLLFARFLSPQKTCAHLLKRLKNTRPQAELSEKERRKNVRGAFVLTEPEAVRKRKILLVDDVMTSGATVEECARLLKKAQAAEIVVAVWARAG